MSVEATIFENRKQSILVHPHLQNYEPVFTDVMHEPLAKLVFTRNTPFHLALISPSPEEAAYLYKYYVDSSLFKDLGVELGLYLPFETIVPKTGSHRTLVFSLDRLFLSALSRNPLFSQVSCLVVSAFGQRSIYTDFICFYAKKLLNHKASFSTLILANHFHAHTAKSYLPGASLVCLPSNSQKAEIQPPTPAILYAPENLNDYIASIKYTILGIHRARPAGHILVFLPNFNKYAGLEADILKEAETKPDLESQVDLACNKLKIWCLNSPITSQDYQKLITRLVAGTRLVLFTPSLKFLPKISIGSFEYVIDPGLAGLPGVSHGYDQLHLTLYSHQSITDLAPYSIAQPTFQTEFSRLISQQDAVERALCGKFAYRLYSKTVYEDSMAQRARPEVLDMDQSDVFDEYYVDVRSYCQNNNDEDDDRFKHLSVVNPLDECILVSIILLKKVEFVLNMDLITPIPAKTLYRCLERLSKLGVVSEKQYIIDLKLAKPCLRLPVGIELCVSLTNAVELGCFPEMAKIVAMQSSACSGLFKDDIISQSILRTNPYSKKGDHLFLHYLLTKFEIIHKKSYSEAKEWCHEHGLFFGRMLTALKVNQFLMSYFQATYPVSGLPEKTSKSSAAKIKLTDPTVLAHIKKCLLVSHTLRRAYYSHKNLYGVEGCDSTLMTIHPASTLASIRWYRDEYLPDSILYSKLVIVDSMAYFYLVTPY